LIAFFSFKGPLRTLPRQNIIRPLILKVIQKLFKVCIVQFNRLKEDILKLIELEQETLDLLEQPIPHIFESSQEFFAFFADDFKLPGYFLFFVLGRGRVLQTEGEK